MTEVEALTEIYNLILHLGLFALGAFGLLSGWFMSGR